MELRTTRACGVEKAIHTYTLAELIQHSKQVYTLNPTHVALLRL